MPLTMRGTPRMPSDRLYKTDAPIMRRGPPRALSSISLPHNSSDSVRQARDPQPATGAARAHSAGRVTPSWQVPTVYRS